MGLWLEQLNLLLLGFRIWVVHKKINLKCVRAEVVTKKRSILLGKPLKNGKKSFVLNIYLRRIDDVDIFSLYEN